MTTNVIARQICNTLKALKAIKGVSFIGNSDKFFIDCDKKSVPKYEFLWVPSDGKYIVYEHRQHKANDPRERINFISFHLYRVLDSADFIIMYKLIYRNRANQR